MPPPAPAPGGPGHTPPPAPIAQRRSGSGFRLAGLLAPVLPVGRPVLRSVRGRPARHDRGWGTRRTQGGLALTLLLRQQIHGLPLGHGPMTEAGGEGRGGPALAAGHLVVADIRPVASGALSRCPTTCRTFPPHLRDR